MALRVFSLTAHNGACVAHAILAQRRWTRLAIGQPVTITWDALPGLTWSGVVDKIPTEIVPLGTRQVGEVLCTIDNTNHKLVPGTNIDAQIRIGAAPGALTVPKEAVRREGDESGVLLLNGDRVTWRKIAVGINSTTRAQIVSGLSEGDSVALSVEQPIKSGDLVKPVYP